MFHVKATVRDAIQTIYYLKSSQMFSNLGHIRNICLPQPNQVVFMPKLPPRHVTTDATQQNSPEFKVKIVKCSKTKQDSLKTVTFYTAFNENKQGNPSHLAFSVHPMRHQLCEGKL